jgi:hypothetical protein
MQFVLRCIRVPVRAGKAVRHAMRHYWGLSHRAARHISHAAIGGLLVCVTVPIVLLIVRAVRGAGTLVPPIETGQAVAVPEPSTILLLAAGAAMVLLLRRWAARP